MNILSVYMLKITECGINFGHLPDTSWHWYANWTALFNMQNISLSLPVLAEVVMIYHWLMETRCIWPEKQGIWGSGAWLGFVLFFFFSSLRYQLWGTLIFFFFSCLLRGAGLCIWTSQFHGCWATRAMALITVCCRAMPLICQYAFPLRCCFRLELYMSLSQLFTRSP